MHCVAVQGLGSLRLLAPVAEGEAVRAERGVLLRARSPVRVQAKKMARSKELEDGLSVAELRQHLEDHSQAPRSPDECGFAHKWRFSERGGNSRVKEVRWCRNVMDSMLEDIGFRRCRFPPRRPPRQKPPVEPGPAAASLQQGNLTAP